MIEVFVILIVSAAVSLATNQYMKFLERKESALAENVDTVPRGKSFTLQLDGSSRTDLISNKALAALQRRTESGGVLRNTDVVIVWAQDFLDHDVLYDTVLENVKNGIKYVYVLDVCHAKSFGRLLTRLYEDLPRNKQQVEQGVDVLFVRNDLTLNNFVCMGADSDHEILFSSTIYGERAFGWLKQSPARARLFVNRVKLLLAATALEQEKRESQEVAGEDAFACDGFANRVFLLDDQVMDFTALVREARVKRGSVVSPSDLAHFQLRDMVNPTLFPEQDEAISKVEKLGEKYSDAENVEVLDKFRKS